MRGRQGAATGLVVSGLNHTVHSIERKSINEILEQLQDGLTGEQLITKFMGMKEGTQITGKELSKWDTKLSKAGKIVNYIKRTKDGLYLDLKFGVESASSLTQTKLKDKSNFTIEKVNFQKINYYHVKGPGTLRGDKLDIYIFNNSHKLKLNEKTSWKLF